MFNKVHLVQSKTKHLLLFFSLFIVSGCTNDSEETITQLTQQISTLEEEASKSNKTIEALQINVEELEAEAQLLKKQEKDVIKNFEQYKEKMSPYEGLAQEEAAAKEAELAKKRADEKAEKEKLAAEQKAAREKAAAEEKAEKERLAAEKKAAEEEKKAAEEKAAEEEKARKAAELAKGYDTGILYEQLARTPDDFLGEKIKFYGKVVQVMEGDDVTVVRLAVNDDYDTILYCEIPKNLTSNNRILDNDYVTLSGISFGLWSYKSTLGGEITIPSMLVDIIDR